MANESIPLFFPGDSITGTAAAAVVGKTFVAPAAGALNVGLGTAGGKISVLKCPVGKRAFGVASADQSIVGNDVMVWCEGIVPVTAGAALTAGQEVEVDANGAAIPWGGTVATQKVGMCVGDAVITADAMIRLFC